MRQTNQKFFTRALFSLSILMTVALQQGCGGGGGGGSSGSSTPTLSLSVKAVKTFHFTWNDVSGETDYRLMENPDGNSGYTQVATIPANASQYDLTVSLPQRINARYMLQACNSDGCTDSNEVAVGGDLASGIGYFKASDMTEHASFGSSVAFSADGNVLAVGAPRATLVSIGGAVYVFRKVGGRWSEEAKLMASNAGESDIFGAGVALSADGSVLAVGARGEDGSASSVEGQYDELARDSGAVYLFRKNSSSWDQQAYIKASDAAPGAYFGDSVALSADGTVLAVGAPFTNRLDNIGAAYVFRDDGGSWVQQPPVLAANSGAGDNFGYSVALSGDGSLLAVGARLEDGSATGIDGIYDDLASDSGAVYLFGADGDGWSQRAYVKPSVNNPSGHFGTSIALSADGLTVAVSEPYNGGAVYLFSKNNDGWVEQTFVTASNANALDTFGISIALSPDGGFLAVGAFAEQSSATSIGGDEADDSADRSGAVYLFRNKDRNWTQEAYIKASNTEADDLFGMSVALSPGGGALAVGADAEDSNAKGINGNQTNNLATDSGAVYLY